MVTKYLYQTDQRHKVTHPGAGQGSQAPPQVKCPALRCCSDSLQCPACSYEVTAWQMLSLWHISSARKRCHWNSSCQRKMVLECCCQGILRIPHLLSFKATLEAFLGVIQPSLIERSWNVSQGALAHPPVHFLSVQTVVLASRSDKPRDTRTHLH